MSINNDIPAHPEANLKRHKESDEEEREDYHHHHRHPQHHEEDAVWKSCCFSLDRGAASFFASFSMSFFLMGFAAYQIAWNSDDSDTALWSSLLSSIASIWLPNPVLQRDSN